MKRLGLALLILLVLLSQLPAARYTQVDLTESQTGRTILSAVLGDGEQAVMCWRNSLFGLDVREVFEAKQGFLVLDEVTFADPKGGAPPEVTPADVEDLYHTGGPFTAHGLGKSFNRVNYRVGEIGHPELSIGDRKVAFKREVGFGGGVLLTTSACSWLEVLLH